MPAKKTFLNEKFLKGLYIAFLEAPPFCDIHMPPVDEVYFYVVDDKTIQGAAHKSPKHYQLHISRKTLSHHENVIEVFLHEMVHLHFLYRGYTDHKHDAKFRRLANKVCDVFHFDKKTF